MLFSEVRSEWWSQEVLVGARVVDNLLARATFIEMFVRGRTAGF